MNTPHDIIGYKQSIFGISDKGNVVPIAKLENGQIEEISLHDYPNTNTIFISRNYEEIDQKVKDDEIVEENSIDLIKLIVAGLTHLYVSKTSKLLKPLQFVLQHKKEVSISMMHFVVPLLMTYFMTTHVGFVAEQLLKETFFMKSVYLGIFFFGSTFVWITSQVLLSGILSMLAKSMLEVAKVGKQNK